jgi:hypothetical protein
MVPEQNKIRWLNYWRSEGNMSYNNMLRQEIAIWEEIASTRRIISSLTPTRMSHSPPPPTRRIPSPSAHNCRSPLPHALTRRILSPLAPTRRSPSPPSPSKHPNKRSEIHYRTSIICRVSQTLGKSLFTLDSRRYLCRVLFSGTR